MKAVDYPNLLVNGTTGIAVGMATNIPPHNLREVVKAVNKIIDNRIEEDRETNIQEVLDIVKAPDFPTGGVILGNCLFVLLILMRYSQCQRLRVSLKIWCKLLKICKTAINFN